jgi:hypothetical protein
MKVQINFKILNPEYSQELADEFHLGEESDGNIKYTSAVGYEMENVRSVELIENENFSFKGKHNNGSDVEHKFSDVLIYRCHTEEGKQEDFAVSKSIVHQTHEAKKGEYDTTRFYFYINPEPTSVHLGNLIVDVRDVPEGWRVPEKIND